ncbi:MAG: DUF4261 domain-containing protein [Holophagales bacterium]|nr:DUF4261 domain-containing protein [Holophagales bacterium]
MPDYGFARTYGVELLCTRPPTISKRQLLAALRSRCPGATPLDRDAESGVLAFVHEDHPIQLSDARIAAQTFIAVADKPLAPQPLAESVQQSWTFPGAAAALHRSHATVVVTDLMSSALEYKARLHLFQRALLGVLEVIPCEAIHWRPSLRLVDPLAFAEAGSGPPSGLFFAGALNVRLFNIQGREEETVMDTLGLAALGLPDLQCHFHGLEVNEVAGLLYNTAWYVFENGDVIEDGQTVDGVDGHRWRCQHEVALVPPEREVLDINPGPRYAAGPREPGAA